MNDQQKEQFKEKWLAFENAFYELYRFANTVKPNLAYRIECIIDDDRLFDFKAELRELGVLEVENDDE